MIEKCWETFTVLNNGEWVATINHSAVCRIGAYLLTFFYFILCLQNYYSMLLLLIVTEIIFETNFIFFC